MGKSVINASVKIDCENYINNWKLLTVEYHMWQIEKCIQYLNREINIEKISNDSIRNMNDAYNQLISWNEKVNNLITDRTRIVESIPNIPDPSCYLVNFK